MQTMATDEQGREARLMGHGRRLLADRAPLPEWQSWINRLLGEVLKDPELRVQALRFVDVLPALRDDAQVLEHFRAYFESLSRERRPAPLHWALERLDRPISRRLMSRAIRRAVQTVARRFVAGADLDEVLPRAAALLRHGRDLTLDLLGEVTVSEAEARGYLERYRSAIPAAARRLEGEAAPRFHFSVKPSSLYSQLSPVNAQRSVEVLVERLTPLARAARDARVLLMLDMEHYESKQILLDAFRRLLEQPEFRGWSGAGIALQAYLRETEGDLADLIDWARRRGTPVAVRLVRGAYWDAETAIARQQGWAVPVWPAKADTDRSFERCLERLLAAAPAVYPAVATHNLRSIALALTLAAERGLTPDQWEIQMLYGMAGGLDEAVLKQGSRLRIYLPYGDLIPGMAYLVRRLLENASSQSMLQMLDRGTLDEDSLAPPEPVSAETPPAPEGFRNLPPRRFTDPAERDAFDAALEAVEADLGRRYDLPGLEPVEGRPRIRSTNPARPAQLVGEVEAALPGDLDRALARAAAALPGWASRTMEERAVILDAVADRLEQRRDQFAAWELFEAGKGWAEADADVAEAVDFLRFYAREARGLARPRARDAPGETNRLHHRPLGVGVVLPPWNFPLAIPVGMLAGAVAVGNTVILKPASLTPVVAHQFCALLAECGLPEGVVTLLPGEGAAVGEALVRHPGVHFVAFTGSRAVGLRINALAAEQPEGQRHVKRVIAEMGGKNAIIVDEDADLDEAVTGVVASAFGYQGQKCSACSRVIAVGSAYPPFLERLVQAVKGLPLGDPRDPAHALGPVIDRVARDRLLERIEAGRQEAALVYLGDIAHLPNGWYVPPAIFAGVSPDSFLAREELFGPVLAVLEVADFETALEIANSTDYALSGGVYSRHPGHLDLARERFACGNLYLNRRITRAMVDRQPFGGFRLSGMGFKAGGPAYLLQFAHERSVTENTLRRGFAPEEGADPRQVTGSR